MSKFDQGKFINYEKLSDSVQIVKDRFVGLSTDDM